MEIRFERSGCKHLDTVIQEIRNQELTQEIRLPEGMPDIGRVLSAWGQPVLRGKEWGGGRISASGGMMVWVLYVPEDGSAEQCMEGWIPFQMNWELPGGCPDGTLRIRFLTRFVDARSVTPRKLMVRAGVATMAEALVPASAQLANPGEIPEGVQLRKNTWPVRMPVEAGEKAFTLEEDLSLPGSAPAPEMLIFCRLDPRINEKRVIGNKLVFRGSGNLHTLYRSREGELHSWDHELPFSQFTELDREYSGDAQADVILSPTALEPELDEEGRIRFRGGLTAQYMVSDRQMLNLADDAYSPGRELEVQSEDLEVPAILENRRENLYGEQTVNADADVVADVTFLPDFPRQHRTEEGLELKLPGQFQVLYYGSDGQLHSASGRWEGKHHLITGENTIVSAAPASGEQPAAAIRDGQLVLSCQVPLELTAAVRQSFPMVTALKTGAPIPRAPDRPSLILKRAGEQSLWEIARSAGTTVDAIRSANGLQEEPAPDRMLLIPVP